MARNKDRSARESLIASGWTLEGAEAAAAEGEIALAGQGDPRPDREVESETAAGERKMSRATLGVLVLAGIVYFFYTIVWFSWAQFYSGFNDAVAEGGGLLGAFFQRIVFWLAPLAPALWFFSALLLNRGSRLRSLALWLAVGAVVLVPLPLFNLGAMS